MILYHGTSWSAYQRIISEQCIAPRGCMPSSWEAFPSRADMVYLSDSAYVIHFAQHASDDQRSVVLEVSVNKKRLYPDEDFLAQLYAAQQGGPLAPISPAAHERFRTDLRKYKRYCDVSLKAMGTCAHLGPIKASAIQRVAVFDARPLRFVFDPAISIVNYQFMGDFYRAGIKWLFGDAFDQPQMFHLPDTPSPATVYKEAR